jgi:hypothetical protein
MRFAVMLITLLWSGHVQPQVQSQELIKVLVLDALDGRPEANVSVGYLCDEIPHSTNTQSTTDAAGIAFVPYTCTPGTKLELDAVPNSVKKEGCGGGVSATFEEIRSKGVIGAPDSAGGIWCPTKISRKLAPVPGQVIMFVKKPTWWQSHVAG